MVCVKHYQTQIILSWKRGKNKHFIWAPEKLKAAWEFPLQESPGGDEQDSDREKISVNMCLHRESALGVFLHRLSFFLS